MPSDPRAAPPAGGDWTRGLQLVSEVAADATVTLRLVELPTPGPAADEVVLRVEAAPVNPSDIGLMLAGADPAAFTAGEAAGRPCVTAPLRPGAIDLLQARVGQPLPVGFEGAGTVVATGAAARHLIGRRVAVLGSGLYAQYRTVAAADCVVFPDDVTAQEAASACVNPLTALGMFHTARTQGHGALVLTAAASSLGQMMNRIGAQDGVPIVNIVRRPAQAEILRAIGARWIVDSTAPDYPAQLEAAIAATRATVAFDAIGGGRAAGDILGAMEAVFRRDLPQFSRYGSGVHKQVYIYGALDPGPTVLDRSWGMSWSIGAWLLTPFLQQVGAAGRQALQTRVVDNIRTLFASRHAARLPFSAVLDPAVIARLAVAATGGKYLIQPSE